MLTYKNTLDRDMKMLPAEIVLGRNVTDFCPNIVSDTLMKLNTPWREKLLHREATLSTPRMKDGEHTKQLQNLDIGNHVLIQNGHRNSLLKWEKHRIIVSIEGHDNYGIQTGNI